MIVPDFLAGQIKIIFHRKAAAMFCRPVLFACGQRCRVIYNGICPCIADLLPYVDYPKILLTFNPISPILLSKQGDYGVVEKVKPDPLNLLANTNVGS